MTKKDALEIDKNVDPIYCPNCDYHAYPEKNGACQKCHKVPA